MTWTPTKAWNGLDPKGQKALLWAFAILGVLMLLLLAATVSSEDESSQSTSETSSEVKPQ